MSNIDSRGLIADDNFLFSSSFYFESISVDELNPFTAEWTGVCV